MSCFRAIRTFSIPYPLCQLSRVPLPVFLPETKLPCASCVRFKGGGKEGGARCEKEEELGWAAAGAGDIERSAAGARDVEKRSGR